VSEGIAPELHAGNRSSADSGIKMRKSDFFASGYQRETAQNIRDAKAAVGAGDGGAREFVCVDPSRWKQADDRLVACGRGQ